MPVGYPGNIGKSDWGGFIDSETNESNPLAMETQPHYVLAGPSSGSTPDVSAFRALVAADLPPFIPGDGTLQGRSIVVGNDYDFLSTDFACYVDASGGSVVVSLPPATGSGRLYFLTKIDDTENVATMAADEGDLIDDSISVNLVEQFADCLVHDAVSGLWHQVSASKSGSQWVIGETASGEIDSINTDFTTSEEFSELCVYLNRLRLLPSEFVITGSQSFTLTDAPQTGDTLIVDYTI